MTYALCRLTKLKEENENLTILGGVGLLSFKVVVQPRIACDSQTKAEFL